MAEFKLRPQVLFSVTLELTEDEARALALLAEYGNADILGAVKKVVGERQLAEDGKGLASLLTSARQALPRQLAIINEARKVVRGEKT